MGFLDDIKIITNQKLPTASDTKPHSIQKKILIVEDEKPLAKVLSDRFTAEGFHVLKAENGKEGLEQIKTQKPDIVLLDILMPVMNGRVMLQELRSIPEFKHTPVIVLTNAGEVDNIRVTKTYHDAIEFLIKSNVTMDEIVEKVKRIIV